VAQIVELPAGLAEEAVKRAVVFVLAELGGWMMRVRERRPEHRIQAQLRHQKE
jgi:hypothetical protein